MIKKLCLVLLAFVFVFTLAAKSSGPSFPPPPPADMPRELNGYDTYVIWQGYYDWSMKRAMDARDLRYENRVGIEDISGDLWRRSETGLEVLLSDERIIFDKFCDLNDDKNCLFAVSRIDSLPVQIKAAQLAVSHFDINSAVEWLKTNNISQNDIEREGSLSYGLNDPMPLLLKDGISFDTISELECAKVRLSLKAVEEKALKIDIVGFDEDVLGIGKIQHHPPRWFTLRLPANLASGNAVGGQLKIHGYTGSDAESLAMKVLSPLSDCGEFYKRFSQSN